MKNVINIIKDDFKLLFSNVISIVVVIGLIVVPGMYVWFNLAGMWDPYNNVDNLEVAIVNDDLGYKSEAFAVDIKIGNNVVSALHENQGLKWAFTDYDDAIKNLIDGKYYAVIVIPQDFSNQLLSIVGGRAQSANLIYYSNEKSNPIAPKITDKGASAIQQSINKTFSNTIYSVLLKTVFDLSNTNAEDDAKNVSYNLNGMLGSASASIDNIKSEISILKDNLSAVNETILRVKSDIPASDNEISAKLNKSLDEIQTEVNNAKNSMNAVQQILAVFGIKSDVIDKFVSLLEEVDNSINNCRSIIYKSEDASASFARTLDSLALLLTDANTQLNSLGSTLDIISGDVSSAKQRLTALSESDSMDQVKAIIGTDSDKFASLVTAPVTLDRHAVFPMANNAASMSGFYISICIWVGSLILAALLEANLGKRRTRRYIDKNLKNWQVYLGRYAIFGTVSLLQSVFIALGCIFFLQIPIVYPLYFVLIIALISVCYSLFIYTLLSSFGSIGKALCVILLVLQISATGGTFPIQLVLEPFQVISPYLPTTHALRAINMCVAGYTNHDLLYYMLNLCLTMIPISLVLGLLLRNPIIKINEKFKEKVAKANLLGI